MCMMAGCVHILPSLGLHFSMHHTTIVRKRVCVIVVADVVCELILISYFPHFIILIYNCCCLSLIS